VSKKLRRYSALVAVHNLVIIPTPGFEAI